jgi:hypothetical protein
MAEARTCRSQSTRVGTELVNIDDALYSAQAVDVGGREEGRERERERSASGCRWSRPLWMLVQDGLPASHAGCENQY